MAGQRGRDVLISIGVGDEPESFFSVAGIRARTISLTAGLIEATTAQSAEAWREVIAGAGVKRAEVAGSGVFKDAMSDALMRDPSPLFRYPTMCGAMPVTGDWGIGSTGARVLRWLAEVVRDVCDQAGANADTDELVGVVSGFSVAGPVTARGIREPLFRGYGLDATKRDGAIVFRMRGDAVVAVNAGRLVEEDWAALVLTRKGLEQDEVAVRMRFIDASTDYQPGLVRSTGSLALLATDRSQAAGLVDDLAGQLALQRERVRFVMAADGSVVEAGNVVELDGRQWRVVDVSDGKVIAFEAVSTLTPALPAAPPGVIASPEPDVVIVDAPPLPGEEDDLRPLAFVFADPWTGPVVFTGGADADQQVQRGRVERPCACRGENRCASGTFRRRLENMPRPSKLWISRRVDSPRWRSPNLGQMANLATGWGFR